MNMLKHWCAFLRAPFLMYLDLGGGGSAPAPDPAIGQAAQQNAEVAREALAYNKQVNEENKPRQAEIDLMTKRIVDQQLAVGDTNQQQASDQWDQFKTLFSPVEQQTVKDAYGYQYLDDASADKMDVLFYDRSKSSIDSSYQDALAEIDAAQKSGKAYTGYTTTETTNTTKQADPASPATKLPNVLGTFGDTFASILKANGLKANQSPSEPSSTTSTTKTTSYSGSGFSDDYYDQLRASAKSAYDKSVTQADSDLEAARTLRGAERTAWESAAGSAASDVEKSYAQAEGQQTRNLASMGINPNSGRALAANSKVGLMKAADKAGAMNSARQVARDKGISLRAGTANFGRNMPNTAANAYGLTLTAGNSASNNSTAGLNASIAGAGQMNQGFNTSINGTNSAGSILNQQYSNQLGAWNAQQQADAASSAGFGNMLGTLGAGYMKTPAGIAMFSSSKKIKTDKKQIDDADTLNKVIDLPVEDWKYIDGVADGGEHIGAYAEDVQKKFGDKAAPGGKAIDIISMHGITLSAVKGLAKQVGKLENKVENIAARGITRRA